MARRKLNNKHPSDHPYRDKARKVVKEVVVRTVAYGVGLVLVASVPFWGIIFKKNRD